MTVSTPNSNLGRHVFGMAGLASGFITLIWHDYNDWDQLRYILNATDGPVFVYAAAAAQIFGGAAIQFGRIAKTGAAVLGAFYLVLALYACRESSRNRRFTIAGATSSSRSLL